MKNDFRNQPWFSITIAACIAVLLYVGLVHLSSIVAWIRSFLGYFSSIVLGCVLAYILNPLAVFYQRTFFGRIKKFSISWGLSIALAVLSLLLVLALLLGMLIPQLVESVMNLINNLDSYLETLKSLADQLGIAEVLKLDELISSSGSLIRRLISFVTDNLNSILNASATAGKSLVNWVIALILSVYLLSSKLSLKKTVVRLMRAVFSNRHYASIRIFLIRCDNILVRYISYTLLDALIVGFANALFMGIFGMQYMGLVSMVVAFTNLIPTFGPVIGAVLGGFILLLVNPVDALAFIIFTIVLQFLDGYIIKPRLFGNSLGVSGVLILISVIVFGNMFGVVGILLAIPLAAIIDFIYEEELLPALEKHRARKNEEAQGSDPEP